MYLNLINYDLQILTVKYSRQTLLLNFYLRNNLVLNHHDNTFYQYCLIVYIFAHKTLPMVYLYVLFIFFFISRDEDTIIIISKRRSKHILPCYFEINIFKTFFVLVFFFVNTFILIITKQNILM